MPQSAPDEIQELRERLVRVRALWCAAANEREQAEHERDEVRAALAEARGEVLGALLLWTRERREAEVAHRPVENTHRRTLDETWQQVARKLEDMLAGAPVRPPLDPAHIEVLRGMLDEEFFAWKHMDNDKDAALHAARRDALEAVLSRETHRG